MVFGDYPDSVKKNAGTRIPAIRPFEKKLVKGSFDFIGLNHYVTFHVNDNTSSLEIESRDITADMALSIDCKKKISFVIHVMIWRETRTAP